MKNNTTHTDGTYSSANLSVKKNGYVVKDQNFMFMNMDEMIGYFNKKPCERNKTDKQTKV